MPRGTLSLAERSPLAAYAAIHPFAEAPSYGGFRATAKNELRSFARQGA